MPAGAKGRTIDESNAAESGAALLFPDHPLAPTATNAPVVPFRIATGVFAASICGVVGLGYDLCARSASPSAMSIYVLVRRDVHALIRSVQRKRTVHAVLVVLVIRPEKNQGITNADLGVYDRSGAIGYEMALEAESAIQPADSGRGVAISKNRNEKRISRSHSGSN